MVFSVSTRKLVFEILKDFREHTDYFLSKRRTSETVQQALSCSLFFLLAVGSLVQQKMSEK
jgi:hypothetical protein